MVIFGFQCFCWNFPVLLRECLQAVFFVIFVGFCHNFAVLFSVLLLGSVCLLVWFYAFLVLCNYSNMLFWYWNFILSLLSHSLNGKACWVFISSCVYDVSIVFFRSEWSSLALLSIYVEKVSLLYVHLFCHSLFIYLFVCLFVCLFISLFSI